MLYSSHCVCDIVAQEIHVDDNESSFRREREVIVNEECIVWTNLWSSDCVQLTLLICSQYAFLWRLVHLIGTSLYTMYSSHEYIC